MFQPLPYRLSFLGGFKAKIAFKSHTSTLNSTERGAIGEGLFYYFLPNFQNMQILRTIALFLTYARALSIIFFTTRFLWVVLKEVAKKVKISGKMGFYLMRMRKNNVGFGDRPKIESKKVDPEIQK